VGKTYNRLKEFEELDLDVAEIKKYLSKVEALLNEEDSPFETVKTQIIGNFEVISKRETTLFFANIDKLTNQKQQVNIALIDENEKLKKHINQLESLKGKETELTDQINRLNKEIEESNKNTDTLTNENKKLKKQIKQLENLKSKEVKLTDQINNLNKEIEVLNKNIDTLTNENKELKNQINQLDDIKSKKVEYENQINRLNKEIEKLNEKIKGLKNKEEPEKIAKQDNSIGMKFTLIPAGEFYMGSEESAAEPVHKVKINNPFYLGTYPVTQTEWKAIMGDEPSLFKGDDLPVEQVSWVDVQEFIKKLNEKEGTEKYRLPSEAEWEYACRAGTTTGYSFGDDESKLGNYAWYDDNSEDETHPVGQKKPNPWGLYDMHGNVWEWVQDRWHDSYDGAPTDGGAWEVGYGANRVIRGGRWYDDGGACPSASRDLYGPRDCGDNLGFRLLQEV
jgi:formylglycine-generating enzyme required for sulfatase activity